MNVKIPFSPLSSAGRRVGVLLLIALGWSVLHARAQVDPAILLGAGCSSATQPQQTEITFAAKPGDTVGPSGTPSLNAQIPVKDKANPSQLFPNDVFWTLGTVGGGGCTGASPSLQCAQTVTGPIFNVDSPTGQVSPATSAGWVQIANARAIIATDVGKFGSFTAEVAEASDGDPVCKWNYRVHVTSAGGGWGDPHITTVEGVAYDFQSAGEFTALRGDKFELQTRQAPVPTTSVPGPNEYTGLASCVAIYTAVAAKIGSNRVTLQPGPGVQAGASGGGLLLRVNGIEVTTIPREGYDLVPIPPGPPGRLDGRIVKVGESFQITDARGTQLVVTPTFWQSQQRWYLDVQVFQTAAAQGVMGLRAEGSWLPALSDGTSLGQRPDTSQQRYQDLYEKFADSWRVSDATSLFDYAPGTNTATFTLDEWPRHNPETCALQGQTSVQPVTPEVAAQACSPVTDAAKKGNCVFDVTVTGNTGFAQSYQAIERITPHGTGWQPVIAVQGVPPPTPPPTGWPWWWWIVLLIILLLIIVWIVWWKKTH